MSVQTQWRMGMAGATGLDYAGVQAAMRLRGMKRRERAEVFECIQAAEFATLSEWAKQRKERARDG